MTPQIINLLAMTDDQIGPLVANTDLRSRMLVATPEGTVGVQSGNVARHFHADANATQLILDGAGSFWLGCREVQVKAGGLIITPRAPPMPVPGRRTAGSGPLLSSCRRSGRTTPTRFRKSVGGFRPPAIAGEEWEHRCGHAGGDGPTPIHTHPGPLAGPGLRPRPR
jgi:hypothetical protein